MNFAQGVAVANLLPGYSVTKYAGDASNNANNQTLAVYGMDGETMGGVKVSGWVRTAAAIGAAHYILAPNGLWQSGNFSTTGSLTSIYGIPLYDNPATTDADFQFTVTCTTSRMGSSRIFTVSTVVTGGATLSMTTTWADSTTPIRFFAMRAVTNPGGNEITQATIQATIATVGNPTQMTWSSLGNP